MAEYIDREALMKFPIRRDHCDKAHANEHFINGIESVLEYAENLPAADVAPVVHGHWEKNIRGGYCEVCSRCGFGMNPDQFVWIDCNRASDECESAIDMGSCRNYCPNCGAKMDGGE